ncbi:MAG TPA: hypothetical protein VE422_04135 [Terriglobia bacterium]|nr:hypothetical protein [Terriglobia bacterium]
MKGTTDFQALQGLAAHAPTRSFYEQLMPQNGDLCPQFGVYRTLCCGEKIVLDKGMEFPDCPSHLKLTTVWKEVTVDELIPRALVAKRKDAA